MQTDANQTLVEIPAGFREHIGPALLRAACLFPDVGCAEAEGGVLVSAARAGDVAAAAREIRYLVYREKIRSEFAPYRRKALDRVYGGGA